MSFRQHLQDVCQGIEGAVACSLIGIDGIEVETVVATPTPQLDLKSLLAEYSAIVRSARDTVVGQGAGDLREMGITTDELLAVAHMVSPEYLIILALRPEGNYGKARYLLRIAAPKVKAEL